MATMTLDDIRSAAEAQYGSLDIEVDGELVRLLNPLRMTKKARKELTDLQKQLSALKGDEDDKDGEGASIEEQEALIDAMLVAVADTKAGGRKLVAAFGDDLGQKMFVFEKYSEGTQAGEAGSSQS